MQSTTTHTLTPEQLAAYDRDGFLVLTGLYTSEEMSEWKQIAKDLVTKRENPTHARGSGVQRWSGPDLHPILKAGMHDAVITPILVQLIGPDVEFLSVKTVYKDGKTNFPSPWHQDWFYWEGSNKTSVWIALDDATPANGCLKFIPGTHKQVFNRMDVGAKSYFPKQLAEKDLEGLPVQTMEVKRGDAVVFHDLAVHSSYPNTSGQDRWSLISTYRNAAVKDNTPREGPSWARPLLLAGHSVNGGTVY